MRATYRIQLGPSFTFDDAAGIVPYLAELGISHVYCSPFLQATPGSTHGYDVVDHTRISTELGGDDGHKRLSRTLGEAGMGQIIDIVPNHMAIAGRLSRWWWDVLKHGPTSRYARFFDIDWQPPEPRLQGKILVPILGDQYGRVLEAKELQLARADDEVVVTYFDNEAPLAPGSLEQLPAADADPDVALAHVNDEPALMHVLLEAQHYRLAYWRTDLELNYRRFFDINELAALRSEENEVFEEVHALALELVANGRVDGLRIDHVDGLLAPEAYLTRLRQRAGDVYIVVEKILAPHEKLPDAWPVEGTTGYDFLNRVGGLFVDPEGEGVLGDLYAAFTGELTDPSELAYRHKRMIMEEVLASDLERLTSLLVDVCERHPRHRDYTRIELREALKELIGAQDVYRTYVDAAARVVSTEDASRITAAIDAATIRRADIDPDLFGFLQGLLLLEYEGGPESEFVVRLQQTTGPVMAKAIEDTLFYNYNRFVALNEVGGDPARFGVAVSDFHTANQAVLEAWPTTMLATATHDTKRGEDVRARLYLLSERAEEWTAAVRRWSAMLERYRDPELLDRNTEYLLYQTLVGAHPLEVGRAVEYMTKAAREGKRLTSWTSANADYEAALERFVRAALADPTFVSDLEAFAATLVAAGRTNSLSILLLKLTCPGVPDVYQGTEVWDLSLVDPDNRRPVDYSARAKLLEFVTGATTEEILARWDDGAPKLFVLHRALRVRAELPHAFGPDSTYTPVEIEGPLADHVVAFARSDQVAVVVPRLVASRPPDWDNHRTVVQFPGGSWHNVLSGDRFAGSTAVGPLFDGFPVALLVREDS